MLGRMGVEEPATWSIFATSNSKSGFFILHNQAVSLKLTSNIAVSILASIFVVYSTHDPIGYNGTHDLTELVPEQCKEYMDSVGSTWQFLHHQGPSKRRW